MSATEIVIRSLPETPEYCLFGLNAWWLCMSKAEWAGWAQATGAVVTLGLLLWQQWRQVGQRRERELQQVLAHRNVAHFVARFIVNFLGPALVKREDVVSFRGQLEVCVEELRLLSRSELTPVDLVEKFVDLVVRSHLFIQLLQRSKKAGGLSQDRLAEVQQIMEFIQRDMAFIDKHLIQHRKHAQLIDGNWLFPDARVDPLLTAVGASTSPHSGPLPEGEGVKH
jgi:hypothetical protein